MRIYKQQYRDKTGETRTIGKWYVEFYDHMRQLRRLAAFKDKRASEEFGRNIDRLISCRVSGAELDPTLNRWVENLPAYIRERLANISLLDTRHEAVGKPIDRHLKDYETALRANGRARQYVNTTVSRARTIFTECRFQCWSDISADAAQKFLAKLRDDGKGASIETSNQYLRALKQFCNWMVRNGRASQSPVALMQGLNSELDRRRERRALTPDECARLIEATKNGPVRWGIAGPERALLYRLALETGLRASELRSLTKSSFDFDADPPTVTVKAIDSKHKHEDVLPLRPEMARELRARLVFKKPADKMFHAPESERSCWRTSMMIRADLKAAGIPYIDDTGKVADFHSLRHTFITNLAKSGVHPKVAQTLARHSSIELTMNCYTHIAIGNLVSALSKLPDLSSPQEEKNAKALAATGTDVKSH